MQQPQPSQPQYKIHIITAASLFISLCCTNTIFAQQFFLGEGGHHWINYYVVEIKNDTAIVENYEFSIIDDLYYQPVEKLVKVNSKDTLFSNGRTKIVLENGKTWIYFKRFKRKLKDYSDKQEQIALIRRSHRLKLIENGTIMRLNQTLGRRNYDVKEIELVERTLNDETPDDIAFKAFENAADSIILREKMRVDFFKSFIYESHFSQAEIVSFLGAATFTKQIEEDILRKMMCEDIENLSQVVENQENKVLISNFKIGLNKITEYSKLKKDCIKALQKSNYQSITKKQIVQKIRRTKTKETFRAITNITYIFAFYGLITKWIFF